MEERVAQNPPAQGFPCRTCNRVCLQSHQRTCRQGLPSHWPSDLRNQPSYLFIIDHCLQRILPQRDMKVFLYATLHNEPMVGCLNLHHGQVIFCRKESTAVWEKTLKIKWSPWFEDPALCDITETSSVGGFLRFLYEWWVIASCTESTSYLAVGFCFWQRVPCSIWCSLNSRESQHSRWSLPAWFLRRRFGVLKILSMF